MRIKVTEEDITQGNRDNSESCPVALAIRRAVLGSSPCVQTHEVEFQDGISVKLPDDTVQRIKEFDDNGTMSPFEFDLAIKDPQ